MNKVFSKNIKEMLRKILVAILIIFTLQQLAPREVHASDGFLGKLTEPFVDLLLNLGDGVVHIVHSYIMNQDESKLTFDISGKSWNIFKMIGGLLVGIGVAVFGAIFLPGVLAGVGFSVAVGSLLGWTLSGFAGFVIGTKGAGAKLVEIGTNIVSTTFGFYPEDGWEKRIIIPKYIVSPENIFQGNIPFFDVDFFYIDSTNDKVK